MTFVLRGKTTIILKPSFSEMLQYRRKLIQLGSNQVSSPCHRHAATVHHRSGDEDTGRESNDGGSDNNQQSTKMSNGNGNGNGNDDSGNNDDGNEGDGSSNGGGRSAVAVQRPGQLGKGAALAAVYSNTDQKYQIPSTSDTGKISIQKNDW